MYLLKDYLLVLNFRSMIYTKLFGAEYLDGFDTMFYFSIFVGLIVILISLSLLKLIHIGLRHFYPKLNYWQVVLTAVALIAALGVVQHLIR